VGIKNSPPRLAFIEGADEEYTASFVSDHYPDYMRVKASLDKQAIMKDFKDDTETLLTMGLYVAQDTQVYIKD